MTVVSALDVSPTAAQRLAHFIECFDPDAGRQISVTETCL